MRTWSPLWLLLLAALLLAAPPVRAQEQPSSFVPVWIDKDARLADDALKAALDAVAARQANPAHIVLLIHGFDVPRADSTQQFETVGRLLKDQFAKDGQPSMVVVGVQWASDVDAGLLALADAYMEMVPVARSVGRQGVRQLLLGLQERFPQAKVSLMAHSMGCEVTAAAVVPESKFKEGNEGVAEPFQPDQQVHLNLITLAGSDLDYDAWVSSGLQPRSDDPRAHMVWMTLSPILGDRDEVLKARALVRGKAGGNTFPKMTQEQYDVFFKAGALFFDNEEIPSTHDFLLYYGEDRIAMLAPAMIYLADPKALPEPAAFQEMEEVLSAPPQPKLLARYLDSPHLNTQIYALWRLEQALCGGSEHLANDFLPDLAYKLRHMPREVLKVRRDPETPCKTVTEGYWPTTKALTRAGAPPWAEP